MGRMKDRVIEKLNGERDMKVVMTGVMCGPDGNAFQNTVLDIPASRMQTIPDPKADPQSGKTIEVPYGEYLVQNKYARPYEQSRDSKLRQHGLIRAER